MNQKTIIVSSINPELYTTKRFIEESKKLNYSKVQYLNPLNFAIPQDLKELDGLYLHRTTGINFDDFDLLVSSYFESCGMRVSNKLNAIKNFRSKDAQHLFLKLNNLAPIKSLLFRGQLNDDFKLALSNLHANQKYVLKTIRGNQGIGVSFINGDTSLLSVLETFKAMNDQRFIIQPFIEHKREYRMLIIKNEIHAVIEKTIDELDFRGNGKRAQASLCKNPKIQLVELAQKAFLASGLDYAGLDIIEDLEGKFHLVEINSVCGFEQVETLSGLNIAREIILSTH